MTDETYNMLEELLQKSIDHVNDLEEADQVKRSRAIQDVVKLSEKLAEIDASNAKWYDDQERRKIESERTKSAMTMDAKKLELEEKRAKLEEERAESAANLDHKKIALDEDRLGLEKHRLTLESERMRNTTELDGKRQKLDEKRILVELLRILTPVAISLATFKVYNSSLDRTLEFEETGRLTSTGSRYVGAPSILDIPKRFLFNK